MDAPRTPIPCQCTRSFPTEVKLVIACVFIFSGVCVNAHLHLYFFLVFKDICHIYNRNSYVILYNIFSHLILHHMLFFHYPVVFTKFIFKTRYVIFR